MEPRKNLGPYAILEPLGKGGMGEVYRAHDSNLRRDVAIKVLPEELSTDPQRLDRLQREARALASLNHAHVATVHGFEEHGGTRFIVMELVEGQTLEDKLAGGALPVSEALDLAEQLARALEAAHEKGIVHRDLKPANVLVTPSGQLKVLDFGLAKPLEPPRSTDSAYPTATIDATRAGEVLGTPPYMSPEQARGEHIDERTDIWAFGCVLYEMLAGKMAFGRETIADTLAAVIEAEPHWDALPSLPKSLRRLIERMLTKNPERRLRHIADARIEIEDARMSDSGGRRKTKITRSIGGLLAASTALAAVAIVAVTTWWYVADGGGQARVTDRSIAVLPFETLGRDEATAFTDGIHGDILTRLSKISGLSVTSRTSVMRYRRPDRPLPEIARELGVTWILRGEVQEVGDQVQVNARLTNAREDRQVWAENYRRQLTAEQLFEIQGEITEQIAAQLQAQLTSQELRTVGRVPTENLQAYRLYSRGRFHYEQRTEENLRRAAEYFQQAIDRDPTYALAWAGLADALSLMEWYGYGVPNAAPERERAASRALELDPQLAEAHASRGIVLSVAARPDAPAALAELERAVELRPSFAEAYTWIAWLHLLMGNPRAAVEPAEQAAHLDPLGPANLVFLAETYLANGDWEAALREARRTREIQPEYALAHYMEGIALYHLGGFDEAESALQNTLALVPPGGESPSHAQVIAARAVTRAISGDRVGARELAARIEDDPFSVGLVEAALGDYDAAFEAFERVQWTSFSTEQMRYLYPEVLGPIRQDPRYEAIRLEIDRSWGMKRP